MKSYFGEVMNSRASTVVKDMQVVREYFREQKEGSRDAYAICVYHLRMNF